VPLHKHNLCPRQRCAPSSWDGFLMGSSRLMICDHRAGPQHGAHL
jgi:hypothetical protein